jgi:hypothetical protein
MRNKTMKAGNDACFIVPCARKLVILFTQIIYPRHTRFGAGLDLALLYL